jgi:hypothetical protein
MFQIDNPLVAIMKWLLIIYVLVSAVYTLVSLILYLANSVLKTTGRGFINKGLGGKLEMGEGLQRFQQCSTYMINPCFLIFAGLAYLANSASISFGLSGELGTVALINAPLIIFFLVCLISFLGNIVTPRTGMGKDVPTFGIAIAVACILIIAGLTYSANSAAISFGWLSGEIGTIALTIDLAIAALSIVLILLSMLLVI